MCGCNGGNQSNALGLSFLANRIGKKQQPAQQVNNALAAAIRIRKATIVNARRKNFGLKY